MKPIIFLTTVALATLALASCSKHQGDNEGASLLSGELPAVAEQPKPAASVANSQAPSKDAATASAKGNSSRTTNRLAGMNDAPKSQDKSKGLPPAWY